MGAGRKDRGGRGDRGGEVSRCFGFRRRRGVEGRAGYECNTRPGGCVLHGRLKLRQEGLAASGRHQTSLGAAPMRRPVILVSGYTGRVGVWALVVGPSDGSMTGLL